MAFENTITEYDIDANSQLFVQGLRGDAGEFEPDLAVDGLGIDSFAHSGSVRSRSLLSWNQQLTKSDTISRPGHWPGLLLLSALQVLPAMENKSTCGSQSQFMKAFRTSTCSSG